ncbi:MAG: S8 family serine peptidase [Verrucomicrobia bacterium]|nr:S8 family serine peptidase [Verrucomicrobiota bacterium]
MNFDYANHVMFRRFVRRVGSSILVCLASFFLTIGVFAQSIRLRNEVITPEAPMAATAALAAAPEPAVSGLFLIQFTDSPQSAWREQLRGLGVELLHYVPEQAFVVKLEGARPGVLRQLGFVRWVGKYRPEYKLHRSLQTAVTSPPAESVGVAVLLSPLATDAETAVMRRSLDAVQQEGRHRFGRVLRGSLNPARLTALANSDYVLWIEPAPQMRLLDEVASRIVAGDGPPGQTLMQSLGYDGTGVTVAVADSGLDSGEISIMHPDIQGRVTALFHYGAPGQLEDAADEHSHGTHVAGIIAGNGAMGETDEQGFLYGVGVAPGASLIGQRMFDAQGGYAPPSSFEQLTRDAKRAGAEIGSNSWGDNTQGRYDISAMEFDELVRDADLLTLGDQPYILEFSAGNAGPGARTINTPAVAKNVIATGASNNDRRNLPIEEFTIYDTGPETMADFSSRGPCEDGRIKPDLVAPGSWIASLRSIYANDDFAWWPISGSYMYQGGTSQAGPHVSGAAAVFVQYYRAHHGGATPSPALVKAALINSATDMDDAEDTDPVPNNDEGWGRLNLPALIASERHYDFTDQTALLTNNAVYEKRILIGSADEPLKVTLAYTDVPGNPAAVIALVNDLDLEVVAPDGRLYRGNRFNFGESIPDAAGADTINNVEAVHLFTPVPGEYIVRVRAWRVVQDARRDTAAIDQDFALVVSGAFGIPGVGIVTFNRPVYRAPDQIRLTLVDYDLAGQPGVNLLLRSGAEPAGENVTLFAHGSSGLFTGAIATATSPAIGQLHIAHGNVIEAVYADAAPPANRVFTALADLVPPVIAGVRATNRFGQPLVSWTTDEETKAIVYYGVSTPSLAQTNIVFDTAHEFALLNFPPDTVIQFMAVAEDAAGNRTTNDNGGLLFTVTNLPAPGVFLLDSYTDSGGFIAAPPLSGYTDALNVLGRPYSVFDARSGVEPSLTELQAYRTVIWRMDEISAPPVTLAQKIADYVNGGGSLLIASMEAVTRLTEAGLASMNTTILQVQSYTEDQPVDAILGAPGDPVGAGMDTLLDYTPYDELLAFLAFLGITDPSDWIVPTTNAAPILLADGQVVGVRSPKTGVDLPGRVVYLSFPLDAVPLGSGSGNNRAGLLHNILTFLAPEPGSSTLTLDSDVYSVPGRAIIEVEDLDLQGLGQTSVTVSSPQQSNEVALFETVRRGLFRGNLIFTPTNTGLPGTLLVAPDDTVTASYFDVSAGQTRVTTAVIETNAPVISDVFIEPGYLEAIVSWSTSKPTDALVLYSESPDSFPINFTAYDPLPSQYHEVFLTGLKPNTTYYLRVSSRDRAGNTTVDDNGGQFYTFTTLQPLSPPWSDNMETNSLLWSVISPDESETQWTRGTPGGGETANSPVNCWGSNLGGGPVSLLESYLISPGVLLSGGNRATLRFWQNYDFLPQSEFEFQLAGIFIITNVLTSPQLLRQLPEDSSFGWEEMTVDLTPYMGHVAYIAFYHFLFSFDAPPRLGWLVDDVSITVGSVTPGTLQITNDLWQAVFALTGPTGRVGGGQWTVITNAAPGEYAIEFGDVPYHTTPLPQTNTLTAGGTITFHGQYTFADANANGIPDGWEQVYFGSVSPGRTSLTDTDDDGLSDYAEYVAGTNPTNQLSALRLTPTLSPGGSSLDLQWPSAPGHGYRVLRSADAFNWTPATDWIRAAGAITETNLPTLGNSPQFLRVQASP